MDSVTYDPLGRRHQKDVDNQTNTGTLTNYLLDGDEEIVEYDVDPGTGAKTPREARALRAPARSDPILRVELAPAPN